MSNKWRDILPPDEDWIDIERVEFTPEAGKRETVEKNAVQRERMKVGKMEAFLKTWSAVLEWCEAYPSNMSTER